MNLKQLEAFVQVAEGGSFSKAAKQLFLTQPRKDLKQEKVRANI